MPQALDNAFDALGSLDDASACPFHGCRGHFAFTYHFQQVARISMDDAQGVVDLVRDSAGHHTEGGEPSRGRDLHSTSLELGFQGPSSADVANDAADQDALLCFERTEADLNREFFAIFTQAKQLQTRTHGPGAPFLREGFPMFRMTSAEALRYEALNLSPE